MAQREFSSKIPTVPKGDKGTFSSREKTQAKEASKQFEALFVKQMIDSMRKTVSGKGAILPKGPSQEIFEDMLYDQYAESITRNSNLGLAKQMYNQVIPSSSPFEK